jgi:hypothetical protein
MRSPEEIEARRAWVQGIVTRIDLAGGRDCPPVTHQILRLVAETLEWIQGSAAPITERLLMNTERTLNAEQERRGSDAQPDPR